jgi:hypothetical protein
VAAGRAAAAFGWWPITERISVRGTPRPGRPLSADRQVELSVHVDKWAVTCLQTGAMAPTGEMPCRPTWYLVGLVVS